MSSLSVGTLPSNSNLKDASTLRPKKVSKWKKFLGTLAEELDESSDSIHLTVAKVRRRASVSTGQASRIVSNDLQWHKVQESLRSKQRKKSGISLKTALHNVLRERMNSMNETTPDDRSVKCVDGRFNDTIHVRVKCLDERNDGTDHLKVPFAVMTTTSRSNPTKNNNPVLRHSSMNLSSADAGFRNAKKLSKEDLFVMLRTASEITDEVLDDTF
eukprot:CAMPEP_0119020002 /NCGR_PEP_ID=MMETSP1176-20130426/23120_1 /TAXON_ID=265551 /ORGANISM="Synedropsis recta cf, Strain CCMP1620" /LENGTH=214 /DNA_ID=CAMNT_0006974349 /DNA_START=24 /DNA_END=668 /DNA_ORIENTATION=+